MYVFEGATSQSRYFKRRAKSPIDLDSEPGFKRECIKCHVRKSQEIETTTIGSTSNLGYNSILNIPTAQINSPKLGPVVDFVNHTIDQLKLISQVQHLTDLGKKACDKTENVTNSKSDHGFQKASHRGRQLSNRQSSHQGLCVQKKYEKAYVDKDGTKKKMINHYPDEKVDKEENVTKTKVRLSIPNIHSSKEINNLDNYVDDRKSTILHKDPVNSILPERLLKPTSIKNVKKYNTNLSIKTRSDYEIIGESIFNELNKQTKELFCNQKLYDNHGHEKTQATVSKKNDYSVSENDSFTKACGTQKQIDDRGCRIQRKSHRKPVILTREPPADSFLEYDTIEEILFAADDLLNIDVGSSKSVVNRKHAHSRSIQNKKSKLPVKVDSLTVSENRSLVGNKITMVNSNSSSSDRVIMSGHDYLRSIDKYNYRQSNCSSNVASEDTMTRPYARQIQYRKLPGHQKVISNQPHCNIKRIFHEMGNDDREGPPARNEIKEYSNSVNSINSYQHQICPLVSSFSIKKVGNLEKQIGDSSDDVNSSIQKESSANFSEINLLPIPSLTQYNLRNPASRIIKKRKKTPTSIIDEVLQSIRTEMQEVKLKKNTTISRSNRKEVLPASVHSCKKTGSCHHSASSGCEKDKLNNDLKNNNNKYLQQENSKNARRKKFRRLTSTSVNNFTHDRLKNQPEEKPTRDVGLGGDGTQTVSVKTKHNYCVEMLDKSSGRLSKLTKCENQTLSNNLKSNKNREKIYERHRRVNLENFKPSKDSKSPSHKKEFKKSLCYITSSDSMQAQATQKTSIDNRTRRRQNHAHKISKLNKSVINFEKSNLTNVNFALNENDGYKDMNVVNLTKIGIISSTTDDSHLFNTSIKNDVSKNVTTKKDMDIDIFPEKDFVRNVDEMAVNCVDKRLHSFPKCIQTRRVRKRQKKSHPNRITDKSILKRENEKQDCLKRGGCRTCRSHPPRRSSVILRLTRKFNKLNEVHDFLSSFTKVLNKSSDAKCRAIKNNRDMRRRRISSGVIPISQKSNAKIKSDSLDCPRFVLNAILKNKLNINESPGVITLFENSDEVVAFSKLNNNTNAIDVVDKFVLVEENVDLELSTQKTPLTTTDDEELAEDTLKMPILKNAPPYFTKITKDIIELNNETLSLNEKSGSDGEFENYAFDFRNPYGLTTKESSHTLLLELEHALKGVLSSSSLTKATVPDINTKERKNTIHRANSTENILVLQAGDASTMLTLDAESTKNVNGAIIYKVVDERKDFTMKKDDQDYIQRWAGYEDFNFSYFPMQQTTVAYTLSDGEQYSNSFIMQIEEYNNILSTANAMIYRSATIAYVSLVTYFSNFVTNRPELTPSRTATRTLISRFETISNNTKGSWKNLLSIMTQIDTYDVKEVAIVIGFRNSYTLCIPYYFAAVFNVIDIYHRPIQYDLITLSSTEELQDFLSRAGVLYSICVNEDGVLTTSREIVGNDPQETQEEHLIEATNLESVSTSTPSAFYLNTKGVQASLHGCFSRLENNPSFFLDTSSDNDSPAVVRLSTDSSERNYVLDEYSSTQASQSDSYAGSLDELFNSDFTICDDDSEPENFWPKHLSSTISLYRKQLTQASTLVSTNDDKMSKCVTVKLPVQEICVSSITSATNTKSKPRYKVVSKKTNIRTKRRLLIYMYTIFFAVIFSAIASTRLIAC